jgi:hypothetical protein
MNKRFLLATKPFSGLEAAVFATSAVNPLELLDEVELELSKQRVAGKVVFDLLLANGHKVNRYFVADFDGAHFKGEDFTPAQSEYAALSQVSAAFLKSHLEEVSTSLLTPAMRYALKVGMPL